MGFSSQKGNVSHSLFCVLHAFIPTSKKNPNRESPWGNAMSESNNDYDALLLFVSWLAFPGISAYAIGVVSIITQAYWPSDDFWVNAWVDVNCFWMIATFIVFVWRNK